MDNIALEKAEIHGNFIDVEYPIEKNDNLSEYREYYYQKNNLFSEIEAVAKRHGFSPFITSDENGKPIVSDNSYIKEGAFGNVRMHIVEGGKKRRLSFASSHRGSGRFRLSQNSY